MNTDWQTWLSQFGATVQDGRVVDFGKPAQELAAAQDENVLCDLSHYGLITATGDDRITFLQGQFTNDVALVSPSHSQLTAYCSPKGRMLACGRFFQHDDTLFLRLPHEIIAPTLQRLRMFVLMAKVTLDDVSDDWIRFGLAGPQAESLLREVLGEAPTQPDAVIQANDISILRLPGDTARFELHGPLDSMQTLWQTLAAQATPSGADGWLLHTIRAGVPEVYETTKDAFVPQMANLDVLNGLSFDKGCYVGQEIVARTHYLGKLKKRMYRISLSHETRPQPGDDLFAPEQRGEQSVGQIVVACPMPEEHRFEALAVIVSACVEDSGVVFGDSKTPVEIESLPYALVNGE